MNVLSTNMHDAFSFFRASLPTIPIKQNQIILVASLALGLLTACFFARCYYFKANILYGKKDSKLEKIDEVVRNSPIQFPFKLPTFAEKKELINEDANKEARDPIVQKMEGDPTFRTPIQMSSYKPPSSLKLKAKTPKKMKILGNQLKPGMIKGLPRDLDELSLTSCSNLTDEDILDLPPNLKKLSITGSKKLTDKAIENLPKTLLEFSISGSILLTDKAIPHLPPQLIKFSVRAGEFTDDGIQLLSETLKYLEDLSLTGLPVSDQMISHLSPTIKKLSFTRCDITDQGFKDLSRDLEDLTLIDCMRVNGEGFQDLPPNLKRLFLKGYHINDQMRELLKGATVNIIPPTPCRR